MTSIVGKSKLTSNQMAEYVIRNKKNPKLNISIKELAEIFIEEGEIEGVRGDIAFCQAIKETGFFEYGGQVLPEQNNYAGIGALNNQARGKGAWFKSEREGVRAQIQHLKGYATVQSLKKDIVDPRYSILKSAGLLGTAPNFEDLNGKWAVPGDGYGESILSIYDKIKNIIIDNGDKSYNIKALILYNNDVDKRAAEYLSDYIKAPIIPLRTYFDYDSVENLYGIGKGEFPSKCKIINGEDRYDTIIEVLKFIGKI
ncbi:glucosaminidase domain-containing protein [Clostridium oceanicum]|uniref:Mannosyl-glycoprotein endo-beta-N-acetylglucosamidase-like domain-containing protein n=1 Tax=Clostridium oceanicum TaxID=1543 RepID=A0ABP3UQU0_9CLOT